MPRRVTSRTSSARGIFKATRLVLTRSMTDGALTGRLQDLPDGGRRRRRSRASDRRSTVADAHQSWDLGIAQVASVGADWLAMRKDRGVSRRVLREGRGSQRSTPSSKMPSWSARTCTSKETPPRRVGNAVKIAADAHHAFMQKRAARAAAPPGRARPGGLSATLFPRRKPG